MSNRTNTSNERQLNGAAARRLQRCLSRRIERSGSPDTVALVAGVDCAFPDRGRRLRAAAVLMDWPRLSTVAEAVAEEPVRFPYIPGLLSFRELPGVRQALARLPSTPDLVLCDGQGIAHPRRLGIAAHLGAVTGWCTIGVGKSRLTGTHETPGPDKGDRSPLLDAEERIGTVLRTRTRVRPLFVSPGHRIGHEAAAAWVLACCGRYRLPEPIRAADRLAGTATGAAGKPVTGASPP